MKSLANQGRNLFRVGIIRRAVLWHVKFAQFKCMDKVVAKQSENGKKKKKTPERYLFLLVLQTVPWQMGDWVI